MNPKKRLLVVGGTTLLAVAVAVPTMGAASPAMAADETVPASFPVASQGNSAAANLDQNEYGVSIQADGPYDSATAPTFTVSVTGYSPGNWINLWYRNTNSAGQPIGPQHSFGGVTSTAGASQQVTADAALPAGNYVVQASVGKYPQEAWSESLPVQVESSAPYATNFGAHLVNKSGGDFPAFAIYLNDDIVVHNLPAGTEVTITFAGASAGDYSGTLTGTVGTNGVLNVSGQEVFKPAVGVPHGTVTISAKGVGVFDSASY